MALTIFSLMLILSVTGWVVMVSTYGPRYSVATTDKIDYVPERYVLLENPDKYTLQAIKYGYSDTFTSFDDTNIDELNQQNAKQFNYNDFYYKYNNTYYKLAITYGDKFPPFLLPQILLAGIIASLIAIVLISFYKTAKYLKNAQINKRPV